VDLDEARFGTMIVLAGVAGLRIAVDRPRIVLVVVRGGTHDLRRRPRGSCRNRADMAWDHAALANHLVERDPRRHRHVEGCDVPEQGEGDQVVAVLADQSAQALALSTEHQGDGPSTVDLVPPFRARRVEPDDPHPSRLHGFDRLDEVAAARHAHVL
jgi:hypothetical protein